MKVRSGHISALIVGGLVQWYSRFVTLFHSFRGMEEIVWDPRSLNRDTYGLSVVDGSFESELLRERRSFAFVLSLCSMSVCRCFPCCLCFFVCFVRMILCCGVANLKTGSVA